jgi:hypothetical protein
MSEQAMDSGNAFDERQQLGWVSHQVNMKYAVKPEGPLAGEYVACITLEGKAPRQFGFCNGDTVLALQTRPVQTANSDVFVGRSERETVVLEYFQQPSRP